MSAGWTVFWVVVAWIFAGLLALLARFLWWTGNEGSAGVVGVCAVVGLTLALLYIL